MWLVPPLDPRKGERYIELVKKELYIEEIDHFYNIIARREDYVNPTVDGELTWRWIYSYDIVLEDALDRWKNWLHEISSRCCACITHFLRCLGEEVCNPPQFDGRGEVTKFIAQVEEEILENHWVQVMDITLNGTHSHWWATHHTNIETWSQVIELLCVWFRIKEDDLRIQFQRIEDLKEHLTLYESWWTEWKIPSKEWIHIFVHTLGMIHVDDSSIAIHSSNQPFDVFCPTPWCVWRDVENVVVGWIIFLISPIFKCQSGYIGLEVQEKYMQYQSSY